MIGLALILGWILELVAFGLAIGGLLDKGSKKALPITGLAISGSIILVSAATVALGISVMHQREHPESAPQIQSGASKDF